MGFHTFVICAYQKSPYLLSCIRSLKSQTEDTEIICTTSTPSEAGDSPLCKGRGKRYTGGLELCYRKGRGGICNHCPPGRHVWKTLCGRIEKKL